MNEYDRDSGGASAVILSFLLGGLTGAALAILFAPRSGKETRDMLADKWSEGQQRARDLRDQVVTKGREAVTSAQGYVDRQREGIEQQKERLAAAVEAGRQAYREEKTKA